MQTVYAHRGMSGVEIENTLAAINRCIEFKVKCIEVDVQLLGDQSAVLFHDENTARLSDHDIHLSELNKTQFKELELNYQDKEKQFPLFLDQFLEFILINGLRINFELKRFDQSIDAYIKHIVIPITKNLPSDQYIISSFDMELLKAVRAYSNNIEIAVLYRKLESHAYENIKVLNASAIHLQDNLFEINCIEELKQSVSKIGIFTVNDKTRFQQLMQAGVDYVFSDYPDQLV